MLFGFVHHFLNLLFQESLNIFSEGVLYYVDEANLPGLDRCRVAALTRVLVPNFEVEYHKCRTCCIAFCGGIIITLAFITEFSSGA
jgi:hypothetical protein